MNAQPQTIVSLVPPFTRDSAILKVRAVEDKWNTRDPKQVAGGYAEDCYWRNRSEFLRGREEVLAFLTRKWSQELEYRLNQGAVVFRRKQDRRSLRLRIA